MVCQVCALPDQNVAAKPDKEPLAWGLGWPGILSILVGNFPQWQNTVAEKFILEPRPCFGGVAN